MDHSSTTREQGAQFYFLDRAQPAASAAARAGVELIQGGEGESLRRNFGSGWRNEARRRVAWLEPPRRAKRILPLIVGGEAKAMAMMESARGRFFYPGDSLPTVARNEARLRVTVSASHTSGMCRGCWMRLARRSLVEVDLQVVGGAAGGDDVQFAVGVEVGHAMSSVAIWLSSTSMLFHFVRALWWGSKT
ncbi:MAG: hypothetical protein CM1200mP34_1440 [Verrucomicrobiales bacterium]|nr:MAG: hypothetical protein CM1200mP34_1440 [Verrucomicrobiales bacterium]